MSVAIAVFSITGSSKSSFIRSIMPASDLKSRKIERTKYPGADYPGPPSSSADISSETTAEAIEDFSGPTSWNTILHVSSETTAEVDGCKPLDETCNQKRTSIVPENSFAELATYICASGTSAGLARSTIQEFLQDASQSLQPSQVALVILRILQIPAKSLSNSINLSGVVLGVVCVVYLVASAWFYHRRRRDIYQDRFLLGGSFIGAVTGIAFGQNVLSITLSTLPWTILLALISSALAHPLFRRRFVKLEQDEKNLIKGG